MLSFGLHQLSLSRFCEQHLLKVPTGSNSVQTCTASILSLCVCTCCFSWPCYKFVLILNAGTHKSQVRPSLILRTLSQNERGVPHSSSNIYPKNHQTIITTLLTTNWSSVINHPCFQSYEHSILLHDERSYTQWSSLPIWTFPFPLYHNCRSRHFHLSQICYCLSNLSPEF